MQVVQARKIYTTLWMREQRKDNYKMIEVLISVGMIIIFAIPIYENLRRKR
jgi:hypothetical protein